jgi:hypothetical protein
MPVTALGFEFGTTAAFVAGMNALHSVLHPPGTLWAALPAVAGLLIFFGSFAAALAPGLILANLALWLIPSVRKALDKNASGVPGASFKSSVRQLARLALYLTSVGLITALIGAVEPWTR